MSWLRHSRSDEPFLDKRDLVKNCSNDKRYDYDRKAQGRDSKKRVKASCIEIQKVI